MLGSDGAGIHGGLQDEVRQSVDVPLKLRNPPRALGLVDILPALLLSDDVAAVLFPFLPLHPEAVASPADRVVDENLQKCQQDLLVGLRDPEGVLHGLPALPLPTFDAHPGPYPVGPAERHDLGDSKGLASVEDNPVVNVDHVTGVYIDENIGGVAVAEPHDPTEDRGHRRRTRVPHLLLEEMMGSARGEQHGRREKVRGHPGLEILVDFKEDVLCQALPLPDPLLALLIVLPLGHDLADLLEEHAPEIRHQRLRLPAHDAGYDGLSLLGPGLVLLEERVQRLRPFHKLNQAGEGGEGKDGVSLNVQPAHAGGIVKVEKLVHAL
mmetsp:Transcript_16375/g.33360  ORF Transcript_16375/g.33360 Transcript_16375/m.33360 type:complete len:324 (+) Transcript_16375:1873-2844(+)